MRFDTERDECISAGLGADQFLQRLRSSTAGEHLAFDKRVGKLEVFDENTLEQTSHIRRRIQIATLVKIAERQSRPVGDYFFGSILDSQRDLSRFRRAM